MANGFTRERILELIALMRQQTVANGCTPGEAAKFAAKVAELVEKYQIDVAELNGDKEQPEDIEVCENIFRTGKKVHNPGVAQVVSGLARGMCCRVIMMDKWYDGEKEAVYGIIGEILDCDLVCQLIATVVPALQIQAKMEGAEHGYEKAGLVRWGNQYLTGAGVEIERRLNAERKDRSAEKVANSCTALVVTGESLATIKREAARTVFDKLYPKTKKVRCKSEYDHTAHERGREAGKRVGLYVGIEGK